jgi:hypothetical protein
MTPDEWRARLDQALEERRPRINRYTRYYEGDHPLPQAPPRAKAEFLRLQAVSRSNWTGLIISAVAERLSVEGFRFGEEGGDEDAWEIWQNNAMDLNSDLIHTEALVTGEAYALVQPNPDDAEMPLITPESPTQMIVETDPAIRSRRLAGYKKWYDPMSRRLMSTVYLPDRLSYFMSEQEIKSDAVSAVAPSNVRWIRRDEDVENPLEVVPIVPFRPRPRLLGNPRSEIDDVTDIQDRINVTLFNRMTAGEFSAFRQRWAIGLDLEVDETTGLLKAPFRPGADLVWASENPEARFGDFAETDLKGYLGSVDADVQHMGALTHTPPHYLLGQIVNISGDALKAAEAGLVAKTRRRMTPLGDSHEEVMRLCFRVRKDETRATEMGAETIWRNPEFRTEGELVDALVKMSGLGVPREALWERWGASQQEIARWRQQQAQEALLAAVAAPAGVAPPAGAAPTATPQEEPGG